MKRDRVSIHVIRRLSRYLRRLDELNLEGASRISSGELGRQLGLTASQIRQDFSSFGEFGQQGYGYNINVLRDELRTILGLTRNFSVIIAGVGNLGHALIQNFDFKEHGFHLDAAFDVDEKLVGSELCGIKIHHTSDMAEYIKKHGVDIAVLTVPQTAANEVVRILADSGIKGIWNFTNIELDNPGNGVFVEDIHFSDSLMTLSYYLAEDSD